MQSLLSIVLLNTNCSLGYMFLGYSLTYMNVSQQAVDQVFHVTANKNFIHGLVQAVIPLGGALGSISAGVCLRFLSRKEALIVTDILSIIGILISLEPSIPFLVLSRTIIGFTAGLNSTLVQLAFSCLP